MPSSLVKPSSTVVSHLELQPSYVEHPGKERITSHMKEAGSEAGSVCSNEKSLIKSVCNMAVHSAVLPAKTLL